jgi:hypothetical protein
MHGIPFVNEAEVLDYLRHRVVARMSMRQQHRTLPGADLVYVRSDHIARLRSSLASQVRRDSGRITGYLNISSRLPFAPTTTLRPRLHAI